MSSNYYIIKQRTFLSFFRALRIRQKTRCRRRSGECGDGRTGDRIACLIQLIAYMKKTKKVSQIKKTDKKFDFTFLDFGMVMALLLLLLFSVLNIFIFASGFIFINLISAVLFCWYIGRYLHKLLLNYKNPRTRIKSVYLGMLILIEAYIILEFILLL